jgi:hypothetical protein
MLDEEWVVKANCRATDKDYFFEKYEEDQAVAVVVDNICLTCPVIIDCFNHGTTNGEWGVWGGVYLVDGEINAIKNAHKTPEIWKELLVAVGTDDEVY